MATQEEVKLGGVGDAHVHGGAGGDVVAATGAVLVVGAEEASVVAFLDDDEGDAGSVVHLQLGAGLADCTQLVAQNLDRVISG